MRIKIVLQEQTPNFSIGNFYNKLTLKIKQSDDLKSKKIGILVGSRGIKSQIKILKKLIISLKKAGATPVIFSAMGGHGNGVPERENRILLSHGLGKLKTKIVCSSKQKRIGKTLGKPVYINSSVTQFDYLIPINSITPHTSFGGPIESGISKMLVVGMGGKLGAETFHKTAELKGFYNTLKKFRTVILKHVKILFCIGIIEQNSKLYDVTIIEKNKIDSSERRLLQKSKRMLPKITVKHADLLIIGEVGKNIAGDGFDPNVLGGAKGIPKIADYFFAKSLTKESHGNAQGMGLLDFASKKFFSSIDFESTYNNAMRGQVPHYAKMPIIVENEKECIKKVAVLKNKSIKYLKIVWIKNSKDLQSYYISDNIKVKHDE